jgi:hypothetical protein
MSLESFGLLAKKQAIDFGKWLIVHRSYSDSNDYGPAIDDLDSSEGMKLMEELYAKFNENSAVKPNPNNS